MWLHGCLLYSHISLTRICLDIPQSSITMTYRPCSYNNMASRGRSGSRRSRGSDTQRSLDPRVRVYRDRMAQPPVSYPWPEGHPARPPLRRSSLSGSWIASESEASPKWDWMVKYTENGHDISALQLTEADVRAVLRSHQHSSVYQTWLTRITSEMQVRNRARISADFFGKMAGKLSVAYQRAHHAEERERVSHASVMLMEEHEEMLRDVQSCPTEELADKRWAENWLRCKSWLIAATGSGAD